MAQQYSHITDRLHRFIESQHVFFVATAARDGRVNVSPKGLDTLRVLAPDRVVWLNLTGSGNETAAHVLDSGRMTLMFCSFGPKPLILRVYGTATTRHEGDDQWDELAPLFPQLPGSRNIFDVSVDLVQTSCGFGVPQMELVEERDTMTVGLERRGPDGVREYQQANNRMSIDGFPTGLPLM
ncbi:MAG: pyridoxamine 5'-phosphate oxidase family protein [Dermatophilaceae bacterium]